MFAWAYRMFKTEKDERCGGHTILTSGPRGEVGPKLLTTVRGVVEVLSTTAI